MLANVSTRADKSYKEQNLNSTTCVQCTVFWSPRLTQSKVGAVVKQNPEEYVKDNLVNNFAYY